MRRVGLGMKLCNKIVGFNAALRVMMPNILVVACLLGGAKVGLAVSPSDTVINFDNITTAGNYGQLAPGYGGVDWTNVYWGLGPAFVQQNLTSSGDHFAFNNNAQSFAATMQSGELFNFVGADFTGWASGNSNLVVNGMRNGVVVQSKTISLIENGALQFYDFGFTGIDKVEFVAPTGSNEWFAMDDFTFNKDVPKNEAPLPSGALALAACGAALTFIRRRR